MRFSFIFVLILCQICAFIHAQKPFFRKDYTYIHDTKSFYKLHVIGETWWDAIKKCKTEGAGLVYPEDADEAMVLSKLIEKRTQRPVFVAGSALLANGYYETINGVSVYDLYDRWATDEPSSKNAHESCMILFQNRTLADVDCRDEYPFICKKSVDSLKLDKHCNMPDLGYVYSESLGRCYKYHDVYLDWSAANGICQAELSYLAVIDSQAEADLFVNISAPYKKEAKRQSELMLQRGYAFVHEDPFKVLLGYHDKYAAGWMTVKGVPVNQTSYSNWTDIDENMLMRQGRWEIDLKTYKCGSMGSDGRLMKVGCQIKHNFICEHEI